jgi:DNA-binding response OmpR family regulator
MPVTPARAARRAVTSATHAEVGDMAAAEPPHPACILVVDDDPGIRRLLRATLSDEGFDVTAASNGQEALAVARESEPDLVILDIEMPVMDGPACFRALRQQGIESAVIILSAHGARAAAAELGADAAIDKPFDPEDIIAHVRRLTEG